MLKRTVIKLSGEAIGGKTHTNLFDDTVIDAIVSQINQVMENGTEVALVVGGGNIWRGRSHTDMNQAQADNIGMLATVMNGLYLAEAFKRVYRAAKVVTPITVGEMTLRYNRETALELMAGGTVIINAAGLGHPYFSTDTVSALRSAELNAEMLLFAKNIDGVYDRNPSQHKDAKKYRALSYKHAIASGLNAADIAAMHLANEARIPSFMFELAKPGSLIKACKFPETAPLEGTYLDVDIKEDFYV